MQNVINTVENYEYMMRHERTVGCTGHILKHVDGLSECRETKDIGEVKLNGCRSGTGIRACIDEMLAGRQAEMTT